MSDLQKAARAVLGRWDSHSWEWVTYGRIAALMADLRRALAAQQAEPVAYQDTAKLTEIVAAEDWENVDPAWRWMYRPLYAAPQQAESDAVLAEREACAQILDSNAEACKNNSMLADVLIGNALAIRARGKE